MPLLEHSIKAHGALFCHCFPQFSPHQARDCESAREPLGAELTQDVAPSSAIPRTIVSMQSRLRKAFQYWPRTSSRPEGNLNHMLAPTFPPRPRSSPSRDSSGPFISATDCRLPLARMGRIQEWNVRIYLPAP